jgi:hypothetical protein
MLEKLKKQDIKTRKHEKKIHNEALKVGERKNLQDSKSSRKRLVRN